MNKKWQNTDVTVAATTTEYYDEYNSDLVVVEKDYVALLE